MTALQQKIPAFINPLAGSADASREALSKADGFDVREVAPEKLADAIASSLHAGAKRILVSGGDGTIGTAATALLETDCELAILPGGTLNHFTTDLGIPPDAAEALQLAASGAVRAADVGMVNGRLFLNTSSVGAYVHFVRTREYLEKRFGYRIASALAALRILFQLRLLAVEIEVDGKRRVYRTPVVFIGVGERELQLPTLGKRVSDGRRGLHVMVVRGRSAGRVLSLGLSAVARGVKSAARSPELDSFIVDHCSITVRRSSTISVDGELVRLGTPLQYKLERDAIQVVCP
ncbi:MAG: diacylglycerol kinase [Gemmatimonadota bacterium]|nr:diacylglycerol kinase [Gemmatimonadota bacterium]